MFQFRAKFSGNSAFIRHPLVNSNNHNVYRYENTEATGDLCHCMGEKCNSATTQGVIGLGGVLAIALMARTW